MFSLNRLNYSFLFMVTLQTYLYAEIISDPEQTDQYQIQTSGLTVNNSVCM